MKSVGTPAAIFTSAQEPDVDWQADGIFELRKIAMNQRIFFMSNLISVIYSRLVINFYLWFQ